MEQVQRNETPDSVSTANVGHTCGKHDRVHLYSKESPLVGTEPQNIGSGLRFATPCVPNGLTKEEKKVIIAKHFTEIMKTLGMDLTDDSLKDTPKRVAKMYVEEIFYGLDPQAFPPTMKVENKFKYEGMVTEINITCNSFCEHHFVPIIGHAHVSYIPHEKVIGLSKLNRIVDYYARRPQVQERLTNQIADKLSELLETKDVAVVIDGMHACVKTRGIKDASCTTRTAYVGGLYKESTALRSEFYGGIPRIKHY